MGAGGKEKHVGKVALGGESLKRHRTVTGEERGFCGEEYRGEQ